MEPDGGVIDIRWYRRIRYVHDEPISGFKLKPGNYVCLEIRDQGHGISDENIEKIFDPFFTTKVQGEGTGLGLAAVFGIAMAHHGAISVASMVGGPNSGSTFTLWPRIRGRG